jgi:hypothetical protein
MVEETVAESAGSAAAAEACDDEDEEEAEPEPEVVDGEEEDEDEEEEVFEDETRARRKLAARCVVQALGNLLKGRCRKYVLSIDGEEERDLLPEQGGSVEGEAAGFREGEWMEVLVICTARVPIVTSQAIKEICDRTFFSEIDCL